MMFFRKVEKAAGLLLYRPVQNAAEWVSWLQECGVPNPVSVDEMKVPLMIAERAMAVVCNRMPYMVDAGRGMFVSYGVANENLAFVWHDWMFRERHWDLRELGTHCGCPMSYEYTSAIILARDIGEFIFTEEMIAKIPAAFMFAGEVAERTEIVMPVTKAAPPELTKAPSAEDSAWAEALLSKAMEPDVEGVEPRHLSALANFVEGRPMLKSTYDELKQSEIEEDEAPAIVVKIAKVDAEERIAYGWASMMDNEDGTPHKDSHGHEITPKAIKNHLHSMIRQTGSGNLDHEDGTADNFEILEGLMFTPELWDALEPYRGRTGSFIGMHAKTAEAWKETEGRDMFSIGAEYGLVVETE